MSARRNEETAMRHAGDAVHYPSADEDSCNTMYIMLIARHFPAVRRAQTGSTRDEGHCTISGTILYS